MILPRKPVRGEAVKASLLGQIIDYMRRSTPIAGPGVFLRAGPGGTIIGIKASEEGSAAETADLYPFKVRFVPSEDDGASATDGDFIVYIPEGALAVAGNVVEPSEFGLPAYTAGDYEDATGWYELPSLGETGTYWLNFELEFGDGDDDDTLFVSIGTAQQHDGDEKARTVARSVALANVTIVPPSNGNVPTPGSVTVSQVTKGPLSYDFHVVALNNMIGRLEIKASDGGIDIDGTTYYVNVETDPSEGTITIGLTTGEPTDDDKQGYCNEVSHDSQDGMEPDNGIAGDGTAGFMGGGAPKDPDNSISQWPCKKN